MKPNIFRTPEAQAKFAAYRAAGNLDTGCVLCERVSIADFKSWRIIENIFPYDKIAKAHHMAIPKRHATELELSMEEMQELREIKEAYIHKNYDFMIEPAHKIKSVPGHFHLHLIVAKD